MHVNIDPLTAEPQTSAQLLFCCLAVLRGGKEVPVEQILVDIVQWQKEYGQITPESVSRWMEESWEWKFARDVFVNRAISE